MNDTQQKNPSISVVIAAYNEEKMLPATLKSINAQTYPCTEIVVADNNSTDKTAEIAKNAGARVVPVKEQGNVYAIDGGTRAAKGDILIMTDADTIHSPHWIEEAVKAFTDPSVVATTGGISIQPPTLKNKIQEFLYPLFLRFNFMLGKPHLVGFNFAVRRDVFLKAGGINKKFTMSADVELGFRMKKYGKVTFSPKMMASPSMRRFDKGTLRAYIEYAKGYFYTVWFHLPPPVKQRIVRK